MRITLYLPFIVLIAWWEWHSSELIHDRSICTTSDALWCVSGSNRDHIFVKIFLLLYALFAWQFFISLPWDNLNILFFMCQVLDEMLFDGSNMIIGCFTIIVYLELMTFLFLLINVEDSRINLFCDLDYLVSGFGPIIQCDFIFDWWRWICSS